MAKAIINGQEIFGSVHLGEGGDVANPNIADVYDPTQTYNTGDRRIYNDVLYVCNDDNVTGAWDSTKWDSATIDEIISALKVQDLDNVTLTTSDNNKILGVSVSGSDISVGAVSLALKNTGGNVTVPSSNIEDVTYTVNDSVFKIITGFSVSGDSCVFTQIYFSDDTHIKVRLRNVISLQATVYVTIYYI